MTDLIGYPTLLQIGIPGHSVRRHSATRVAGPWGAQQTQHVGVASIHPTFVQFIGCCLRRILRGCVRFGACIVVGNCRMPALRLKERPRQTPSCNWKGAHTCYIVVLVLGGPRATRICNLSSNMHNKLHDSYV